MISWPHGCQSLPTVLGHEITLEEPVMSLVHTPHGFNYSFIWLDSVVPERSDWKPCKGSLSSWFRYLGLCLQHLPLPIITNVCFICMKAVSEVRDSVLKWEKLKRIALVTVPILSCSFSSHFHTCLRPLGWRCLSQGCFWEQVPDSKCLP